MSRRWKPGIVSQMMIAVLLMVIASSGLVHFYDGKKNESRHQEQSTFLRSATLETLSLLEAQDHVQGEKATLQEGLDGETNYAPEILNAGQKAIDEGELAIKKAEKLAEDFRQRRLRNGPDHPENHDLFLAEDMVRKTIECFSRELSDLKAFKLIVDSWVETKRLKQKFVEINEKARPIQIDLHALSADEEVPPSLAKRALDTAGGGLELIKEAHDLASSLDGVSTRAQTPVRKRRLERMAEQLRDEARKLQEALNAFEKRH